MKHQIIIAALLLGTHTVYAQSVFDDDIYYNPKKTTTSSTVKKESNYIANMADMDVDAYNRRGEQYYTTAIDTIGSYVENGEDFVYTQQIQKYYNPTIVVDNADVLGDVLANAYGNVEIVIDNNGLPVFYPYYGWLSPYYSSWWGSSLWGFSVSPWGWSVGFYDPWYNWGWGPSWAWGPAWGWGSYWHSGWGWGHGWGGHPGPRPHMADYRPGGNGSVGPRPGWSGSTRPGSGGNLAHRTSGGVGNSSVRPGSASSSRPGLASTRPGGLHTGVVNNNGRWEYNTTATTGHRQAGTGAVTTRNSGTNKVTTSNRVTTNMNRGNVSTQNNSNTSRNTNVNRNTSTSRNSTVSTSRTNSGNRGVGGGSRGTGGGSRGGGGGRHR